MGLPTALLLAKSGLTVYGYDIDKKKELSDDLMNKLNAVILEFKQGFKA